MTNYEKYKDEILGLSVVKPWAITKDTNKLQLCNEMSCLDCLFNFNGYSACGKAKNEWLGEEYVEKIVGKCAECEYFHCVDGLVDTGVCSTPYFDQFVVHIDDVVCKHAKPREQEK